MAEKSDETGLKPDSSGPVPEAYIAKGEKEQTLEGGSVSKEVFVEDGCSNFHAEGKRWGRGAEALGKRKEVREQGPRGGEGNWTPAHHTGDVSLSLGREEGHGDVAATSETL